MPFKLYKRGDIWHYSGTVGGRRIRGSAKTSQKEIAQREAVERERREFKRLQDGPEAVLTFAQAAILYLQAEKPTRFVDLVGGYWKEKLVKNINSGTVRQAAIALLPNASGATRNRQVIVPTQAIINHAASMNLCRPLKVERFPVERKVKEPATKEWIGAFMAQASPQLGALACFMFLTGARITEAVELRWKDIDLQGARALIRQTKVGAERRPHLPPMLVVALARIPSNREPDAKVFGYSTRHTVKPVWRAAIKRAGIKNLSFHACRHGFATALLHAGVDPVTVAKLGGWATPQHVFATYGHAQDDETLADKIFGTPVPQAIENDEKTA